MLVTVMMRTRRITVGDEEDVGEDEDVGNDEDEASRMLMMNMLVMIKCVANGP